MSLIDSNPTFNYSYKGKYNYKASFKSLNIGSDAYVTEQELNEMQFINSEQTSNLIREITRSGVITENSESDNEDNIHNRSKCFLPILGTPNTVTLPPFQCVINGDIINIKYVKDNVEKNLDVRLPNPPVAGTRNDFIFLQCWIKELKENDDVHCYGYEENDKLPYSIIDDRCGIETCRRLQFQWQINVYEDYEDKTNTGFIDGDNNPNPRIHPTGLNGLYYTDYYFIQSDTDPCLYIAGEGNTSKIPTVDGFIYAIPLFTVRRINNSGYSAEMNPYGGIDYINASSISDRPDNKFSNIIYEDQIIDLRHLAALGEKQYNKIYATLNDVFKYQTMLKNKINHLSIDLKACDTILHNLGYSIPEIYDKEIYGIDCYRQNGITSGGYLIPHDDDSLVIYRKNKYYVGHQFEEQDYVVIPTLYEYNYDEKGELGDYFITKGKKYFIFNNTGAKDLQMNFATFNANDKYVMSGTDVFNGTDGTEIDVGFDLNNDIHFISIIPNEDTNGRNGDIYIRLNQTSFTVFNTGLTTDDTGETVSTTDNEFTWVLIDISNSTIRNLEMFSLNLNGPEGITKESLSFGENYSICLSTPWLISSGEIDETGQIGEIFVDTEEENKFTVYQSGSIDTELFINCLVFCEVPHHDLYDVTPVDKTIPANKIDID